METLEDKLVCGDGALSPEQKRIFLRFGLRQLRRSSKPDPEPKPYLIRVLGLPAASDLAAGCSPLRTYTNALLRELCETVCDDGATVVDAGCGAGQHALLLEESGKRISYLGVDASWHETWSGLIDRPSANLKCAFRQGDAKDMEFDVTMTSSALEHFQDDRRAVRAFYTITRPGKFGIHIVPAPFSLFLYGFHGWRRYRPDDLLDLFRGSGFVVERLYSLGGLATFCLHFIWISWLETGLIYDLVGGGRISNVWQARLNAVRFAGLRRNRICLKVYAACARLALWLDCFLPWPAHGFAIIVRRAVDCSSAADHVNRPPWKKMGVK